MNDQLPMFEEMNSGDTASVISSPALVSGALPCDGRDGPTTDLCGLEAVPAPASAQREKAKGLQTLVTSGLIGRDSSASAILQRSLESKCQQRLDTAGSTLFKQTWKRKRTPLGRSYLEHTAQGLRTSGKGCTSVPTPNTMDTLPPMDYERRLNHPSRPGRTTSGNLREVVTLGSVPTPMAGSPATETYNAAGNTDYSRGIVELASVPTPCAQEDNKSVEAHLAMKHRMGERDGTHANRTAITSLQVTSKLSTVATPRSEDSQCAGAHRGVTDTLHSQANLATLPTPAATEGRQGFQNRHRGKKGQQASLSTEVIEAIEGPGGSPERSAKRSQQQAQLADSGQIATGGTEKTGNIAPSGQLDPAYSRWLMGVPPVWDLCAIAAWKNLKKR